MRSSRHIRRVPGVALTLAAALIAAAVPPRAAAAPQAERGISVAANVETRDVYVGESFLFQISVDGSDRVARPDLSALEGFDARFMGGSNNSSQSISIINGKVERTVKKGFVFTWKLTPRRSGTLTIPAVEVEVEGNIFHTRPVSVSVRKPEESEDFKLRARLSRETCYVGEPVVLTVTWYLRRDVQAFEFTAPVLSGDSFTFESPEVEIDPDRQYFRIQLGSREAIAEKGRGMLDGETYATLEFDLALIPERPGTFVIPEFVVSAESGTGLRSRRDFFEDFFGDGFTGRWRGSLKKYVVQSNPLSLRVKPLPEEGRPGEFAGHIGQYEVSMSAEPTEVAVGDPITLRIELTGPDYLGRVRLPPLSGREEFSRNFKIPDEMADGEVVGRSKVFTQTIRVRREDVERIPPVELVYFDTAEEEYVTARSEPIPLEVRPTRVVTAGDAEGIDRGVAGAPLERWKAGIAFNYEGSGVIEDQGFSIGGPGSILLLALPPGFFLALLGVVAATRRRRSDPGAARARSAIRRLRGRLAVIPVEGNADERFCSEVMEALRDYLGDRTGSPGAALTRDEIGRMLADRGVGEDLAGETLDLLGSCELGAYAGGAAGGGREDLLTRARETAGRLDGVLR